MRRRTRKVPTSAQLAATKLPTSPTMTRSASSSNKAITSGIGSSGCGRNRPSVRVDGRMTEQLLELANHLVGEGVLHGFGVAVNVVRWQIEPPDQVELPDPMRAHDPLGFGEPPLKSAPALRRRTRPDRPSRGRAPYAGTGGFSVLACPSRPATKPDPSTSRDAPPSRRDPSGDSPGGCERRDPVPSSDSRTCLVLGRRGAISKSVPLEITTIVGPVGILSTSELISAPSALVVPPITPARMSITPNRSVHCLAAAAGVTSDATMRTTPTVWRPIMTTRTSRQVSAISSRCMGRPRLAPNPRSKQRILNSLWKATIVIRTQAPTSAKR